MSQLLITGAAVYLQLLFIWQAWAPKSAEVRLYVTPNSGEHCDNYTPCHTMSEYLEDLDYWIKSNTTFYLLSGSHTVKNSISVFIEQIEHLSMVGFSQVTSSSIPPVHIQCSGMLEFCFKNVTNVYISNIAFHECGMKDPKSQQEKQPFNIKIPMIKTYHINQIRTGAALIFYDCHVLSLQHVHVLDSNGYGMILASTLGTSLSLVVKSKFHNNIKGGNTLFILSNTVNGTHNLTVSMCNFSNGINTNVTDSLGGGGLGIIHYTPQVTTPFSLSASVNISISESNFSNNSAIHGGNLFIVAYNFMRPNHRMYLMQKVHIHLQNCTFFTGKVILSGGGVHINAIMPVGFGSKYIKQELTLNVTASTFLGNAAEAVGGAIVLNRSTLESSINFTIKRSHIKHNLASKGAGLMVIGGNYLDISECSFINNTASMSGGGAYFLSSAILGRSNIADCNFTENSAALGAAITFNGSTSKCQNRPTKPHIITLSDNNFISNSAFELLYNSAVVHFQNTHPLNINSSSFINNNISGVYVNTSTVFLQGNVRFIGNRGVSGGAFHIACHLGGSQLQLGDVSLFIANNTAEQYGGAVVIEEECNHYGSCFFKISQKHVNKFIQEQKITMTNNTAGTAGHSIFGGFLDSCSLNINKSGSAPLNLTTFQKIFGVNNSQSASEISSPPLKVCFCNEQSLLGSQCTTTVNKVVFPGEEISVLAATVGQYGGISPAIVRTHLFTSDKAAQLGPRQKVQDLGRECGVLTYSLTTAADHAELHLDVESAKGLQYSPSVINLTFLPCPFGFQLYGNPPSMCDCETHLRVPGVTCNITSQIIHHPASMWIGNFSGDITLHRNCPFDFCKSGDGSVSPNKQDDQCAFNHSGVLCGGCSAGLSASLGSTQCLECSNVSLLLIFPFALAGIALVCLLLKCNITVSSGTINGLIFYANIVKINHSIFFPAGHTSLITKFLGVFISWLNLDLGIETCFFHGMDTYAKTWLQFSFPVYIWILAGAIIIASRYSFIISLLTGKNAVPVLATLFLLSYAKLLRAIIAAISPITLLDKYGSPSLVWLLDGNVPYLEGAHVALFGMALLATLLYIAPFTMLVLLASCLQAHSGHWLLQWVNRLKPLLDAYEGPYNIHFRFWTGIMLLMRVILFAIFAGNAVGDPQVNLLAIAIVISGVLLPLYSFGVSVYKRRFVQVIEVFFLCNLSIFTVASLFLKVSKVSLRKQEYLTGTMVGSAFIVFIVVMVYHFYQQVKDTAVVRSLIACCIADKHDHDEDIQLQQRQHTDTASPSSNVTMAELRSFELREPLLTNY